MYLLFAGSTYYPSGGWEDYKGKFDSITDALESLLTTHNSIDWWHIVHEDKIIKSGRREY